MYNSLSYSFIQPLLHFYYLIILRFHKHWLIVINGHVKDHSCMSWWTKVGAHNAEPCDLETWQLGVSQSNRATQELLVVRNTVLFQTCSPKSKWLCFYSVYFSDEHASYKIPYWDFKLLCVVSVFPLGSAKFIPHSCPHTGDWLELINSPRALGKS